MPNLTYQVSNTDFGEIAENSRHKLEILWNLTFDNILWHLEIKQYYLHGDHMISTLDSGAYMF